MRDRSRISLIVAMDAHRGIGYQKKLLCHLPADLAYFKAQTMGKPMIMGHHTFQSIGKPLPGRRSVVLTRQAIAISGVDVVHSMTEAIQCCGEVPEIMVIGGADVYQQFLSIADRVYVTRIEHIFQADVFFPILQENEWSYTKIQERPQDAKNVYALVFAVYERMHAATTLNNNESLPKDA